MEKAAQHPYFQLPLHNDRGNEASRFLYGGRAVRASSSELLFISVINWDLCAYSP
jgi:hypothetical protein